jgi:chaperone BCS1
MIADAKDFLTNETKLWYHQHGIFYKKAYLLHGAGGSGKTTSIRVMATELNKPLHVLTLSQSHLDDTTLIELMHEVTPGSIIAIEDLDSIFSNHNVNVSQSTVSFATLLNILDGNLSKEGVIIVFTCNKLDFLDDVLLRCGRIDAIYEFKSANDKMKEKMFVSFYPQASPEEIKQFLKAIKDVRELSLSTLQGFFISNRKSTVKEAIENASKNIGFFHRRSLKRKGEFE